MERSFFSRIGSAHAVAFVALVVALSSGGAYAATQIGTRDLANGAVTSRKIAPGAVTPSRMSDYFDSGLVKLDAGSTEVVAKRGHFTMKAKCKDMGSGLREASLFVKNTGSTAGVFESDFLSNYADPIFDPNESLAAFYTTTNSSPYWFGEYYNHFSATSGDGKTSIYGFGNIGVNVLDSDCVFQLYLLGS